MAKESLSISIDFTNREYNQNENFEIMQGGGYYNITCSITNGGVPISGSNTIKLYVVTSDSLDYFKTTNLVNEYDITGNAISLTEADKKKLFNTKGHCQLILSINGEFSLPFNYYVINNPVYELVR